MILLSCVLLLIDQTESAILGSHAMACMEQLASCSMFMARRCPGMSGVLVTMAQLLDCPFNGVARLCMAA